MIVKYLNNGTEFLEFELKSDLKGFITVLQESENIVVNHESYNFESIELRTIGEDNSVIHQVLIFLTQK